MTKNIISATLIVLLANLAAFATLNGETEKESKYAQRVKAAITKLGTGPEVRLKVQLRDNTRIQGYISNITETTFIVIDAENGASTKIPYDQVKKVKGKNNLTGRQVALGAIIVVAVLGIMLLGAD